MKQYCIDVKWFKRNNRSFEALLDSRLCPLCKSKSQGTPSDASALLETIATCCSRSPDFSQPRHPLMEVVFRLLLARGNKPIDLETLVSQLNEAKKGVLHPVSPEILQTLLASDRYYGIAACDSQEQTS